MPLQQLVQHDAIEESTQAEPKENAGVAELGLIDGSRHPTSQHRPACGLSLAAACTGCAQARTANDPCRFRFRTHPQSPRRMRPMEALALFRKLAASPY